MKKVKLQGWMPPVFVVVWSVVIYLLAQHWPFKFNFEKAGQLGDSFGVVSAVMSAIAAIYAFRAFDQAKVEAEQAAMSQQTRDDELTVFRMLEARRQIIASFKFSGEVGLAAIQAFAEEVRKDSRDHLLDENIGGWLPGIYKTRFEDRSIQHLWHYFRFTYHLVRFIDERFKDRDVAYRYVRMLRAELSDAEQQAIALNGLYFGTEPEDRKFKPLIEKYALLHNISDQAKHQFGLGRADAYSKDAFDYSHPVGD
ncbi:hypothetical protein ASD79_07790 [Caulobacter sp. Root655]|uniref:putative phage abortive infection protein n=1 Tax=Caulobacter sp. Root655 TaxID=1736578 RepID=UPI0006F76C14|nr:putative phage abortive infection protein [Caulobacter sp. Root655]KRA60132.1 hypothetical protein ASD79_07790 [Caulobacter sp. Root655]